MRDLRDRVQQVRRDAELVIQLDEIRLLSTAWKQGKFLIGGYQDGWDPYFVPDTGGEPQRIPAGDKDDKPSDWWVP